MSHENTFAVSRFLNRNGVISWRVAGWFHGVRIRKNFKTKEEAAAEKAALELKAMQATSGLRSATTFLVDEQLREAETAFRRLAGKPHSLAFYLDFAFANYREPVNRKLLTEAVTEYVAMKEHEREQDMLSEPYLVHMKRDLDRLQKHFPGATVAELTGTRLIGYFEARRAALKTYNNRRGIVSTFLKFALQRDWITDNPLTKIPPRRIRRRRGGAATLTAAQAKEMMAFVEEHHSSAVPFFALCLFAGIRPCLRTGEILRLRPDHTSNDLNEPWGHTHHGVSYQSDNPLVMAPAGGVHCSLEDWCKFISDQLRGSEGKHALLKAESYSRLHTAAFGGSYALGWFVANRAWGGGQVFTHAGSNTLNMAVVWMAPARDFAVLIVCNQAGSEKACDEVAAGLISLRERASRTL
ncbi:MAG TPA: serine hydrolase [Opitutaceae bacterium]|jgi:hypothetical protein